ncbi:MAG: hypothetical protein ACI9F9_002846 [Candidatus Paceibacteria bacterium]|jgi:hypothetical protein
MMESAGTGPLNPFYIMRAFTLCLFSFWAVRGYVQLMRNLRYWTALGVEFGIPAPFIRRQVFRFALRVTVLDPVYVALLSGALALWFPLLRRTLQTVL